MSILTGSIWETRSITQEITIIITTNPQTTVQDKETGGYNNEVEITTFHPKVETIIITTNPQTTVQDKETGGYNKETGWR